jgi:hypothetical protein
VDRHWLDRWTCLRGNRAPVGTAETGPSQP